MTSNQPATGTGPMAQICEAYGMAGIGAQATLHLRGGLEGETVCGIPVFGGTMIPLAGWGAADRLWCRDCAETFRQAGGELPEAIKGRERKRRSSDYVPKYAR